jgi:hypothetical protein
MHGAPTDSAAASAARAHAPGERGAGGVHRGPDRAQTRDGRDAMFTLEFWYTVLLVGMLAAAGVFAVYVLYRLFNNTD